MIVFLVGTTAELIKIEPILKRIKLAGGKAAIWSTGQQPMDIDRWVLERGQGIDLRFLNPETTNLSKRVQVPPWLFNITKYAYKNRKYLRKLMRQGRGCPAIVVHGDTMTTSWGIFLSKLLRVDLIHVEAGLRSGRLFDPFPEEVSRRLVSRFATVNYAPNQEAVRALSSAPGRVVFTHGNSIMDAVAEVNPDNSTSDIVREQILVSLHRSELLGNRAVLDATIEALIKVSHECQVIMVVDSLTQEKLNSSGNMSWISQSSIEVLPKMSYGHFQSLLRSSRGVITDSGGLQEECAALHIPCLIHRKVTERSDGIGKTAFLTYWDCRYVIDFPFTLANIPLNTQQSNSTSPSDIIVNDLSIHGFLKEAK